MSLYDYKRSIDLSKHEFYALLMAVMRNADSQNQEILETVYPRVWSELRARYNAPDGVLPSDTPQYADLSVPFGGAEARDEHYRQLAEKHPDLSRYYIESDNPNSVPLLGGDHA